MALKKQNSCKNFIYSAFIIAIALSLFFAPTPAQAQGNPELYYPNFQTFVESVKDGNADLLKGVYVPDEFALPIVQQPVGNPGFVSQTADVVTQFSMAAEVGNVGLLAHNHLAGQAFFNLSIGDEVRLVYGDGKIEYFTVTELLQYQAMQPYSPYSEFRDLESGVTINAEEMFRKVYRGDRHVTFQVCIEENGIGAWGRLFVIAQPKTNSVMEKQFLARSAMYQFMQ